MNDQIKTSQLPSVVAKGEMENSSDQITLNNDSNVPVVVTCSNGFLGLASIGYALPGKSIGLPCSPALWDISILFETDNHLILNGLTYYYNKTKGNVSRGTSLKVSDFK